MTSIEMLAWISKVKAQIWWEAKTKTWTVQTPHPNFTQTSEQELALCIYKAYQRWTTSLKTF